MTSYYPPVQEGALRALLVIRTAIQNEGKSYLAKSTYSADIVAKLQEIFTAIEPRGEKGEKPSQPQRPKRDLTEGALDLEAETRALYDELVNFTIENDGQLDTGEVLNAIKTRTQLLEKLLGQAERASDVKKFNQFREFVITQIQAYLTADERNQFLTALENL